MKPPKPTAERMAELAGKYDALLVVVNAILLAYGNGPDGRLRVVDHYSGKPRREVAVERVADGILVYLVTKEEPDGRPN